MALILKVSAEGAERYIELFYKDANHDHMVKPGMIYISHPTEYGTLYTKEELEKFNFFSLIKQQGALLANGRILGIQFDTLLRMVCILTFQNMP